MAVSEPMGCKFEVGGVARCTALSKMFSTDRFTEFLRLSWCQKEEPIDHSRLRALFFPASPSSNPNSNGPVQRRPKAAENARRFPRRAAQSPRGTVPRNFFGTSGADGSLANWMLGWLGSWRTCVFGVKTRLPLWCSLEGTTCRGEVRRFPPSKTKRGAGGNSS